MSKSKDNNNPLFDRPEYISEALGGSMRDEPNLNFPVAVMNTSLKFIRESGIDELLELPF